MASRKSPLRDRLLSNSPDPIKSSILRESGMGWNTPASTNPVQPSGSASSITSPLRIAKRDSPGRPKGPAVARRTSSSYRHVHTNNLVSKSPFKSQIPTPATPSSRASVIFPTRKVSGEKRPRPSSMHELGETENERPFALKRDRKQSKTFQGLLDREPVTKSPFRNQQESVPVEAKPPPTPLIPLVYKAPRPVSTPPPTTLMEPPVMSPPTSGPSPGRSSLVSRRMHGPRLSGGSKRERRKTVTFHERCDVLEFDPDDMEDDVFESADEHSHEADDTNDTSQEIAMEDNPPNVPSKDNNEPDIQMEDEPSYESISLSETPIDPSVPSLLSDPDASITGIVEEMFFSSNAANLLSEVSVSSMHSTTSTPPRHHDIPTDLETEDGVPFGRSHHVDRFLQHHQHQSPNVQQPPHFSPHGSSPVQRGSPHQSSPFSQAFGLPTHASPLGPPATPPRRSPAVNHGTPPLGRSTHVERIRQVREEEKEDESEAENVSKLPPSPSPMKRKSSNTNLLDEGLIPRFHLENGNAGDETQSNRNEDSADPFAPRVAERFVSSESQQHDISDSKEDSTDTVNVSIGSSEINLSALASERDRNEVMENLEVTRSDSVLGDINHKSPSQSEYPSAFSRHAMSPGSRSGSPLLSARREAQPLVKTASRERISREEVQRRLMNQRSPGSPGSGSDKELRSSLLRDRPSFSVEHGDEVFSRRSPALMTAEKQQDRLSVLTTQTDFSIETATLEVAEKRTLGLTTLANVIKEDDEFGMLQPRDKLQFDFGSKFSMGDLGFSSMDTDGLHANFGDNLPLPPPQPRRAASFESNNSGIKVGDVDVDMDMKSALDRLMEDVAGAGAHPDDSIMTDEYDESFDRSQSQDVDEVFPPSRPKVIDRAATDSICVLENEMVGVISRSASAATVPPPVPPKDNIRNREQAILEKRREARRMEEEQDELFSPRQKDQAKLGVGRPSRRRSMSTGDAETLGGGAQKRGDALLDLGAEPVNDRPLSDSIEQELQKLVEAPAKSKYHVRERAGTIYASSSDEKVTHMAGPGDVNAGRAWRTVRRPSDMNEYAKQIREYRAQDKGKAYGKVFVKVLGIRGLKLPLPGQPTVVTCTLNNGIHFVTTPECQLSSECRIEQEFELIEHSKLEFTLTLKVRRDPHIISEFKALAAPPPVVLPTPRPAPAVPAHVKSSGMRSFFSSSPKKSSKEKVVSQPPPPVVQPQPQPLQRLPMNLARHLKPDGTLARAFISFKDVASHCDTRLFETSYPLIGQRVEVGGKFVTLEVGEIVLQLFRLPPLPGIPQDQLPQSLEESHRGIRHINWHKVTYFQGTLTQYGGDCSTWRRRQLRVIGANLVAFNDVTKKATATIDLKKAIAVEDDQEARANAKSPASAARASRYADEYDGLYGVERSFRLIFPDDQEIVFFADADEEKAKWLEVLRALVGHIPPHPLWAELLWQRQEEMTKRLASPQQSAPSSSPDFSRRQQR